MVGQLYGGLFADLKSGQHPLECMGDGQLTWREATGAALGRAGDKGRSREWSARERGKGGEEEGRGTQGSEGFKRRRKVGDSEGGSGAQKEVEDKEGSGEGGELRCEVCNIIFSSSQALGGHRTNSTDHKQNLARIRRQEQEGKVVRPRGQARLSKDVYSNPPADQAEGGAGRRARLPSMAQMPGFFPVLRAFPPEVATDICLSQSPTAYFSSCRLDLFRRHSVFGTLGLCPGSALNGHGCVCITGSHRGCLTQLGFSQ